MSSIEKPILVLIPGAFHLPYHYARIISLLGAQGYQVMSDRNLTCDSKNPRAESVLGDVEAIRDNIIKPLVNNGQEVIMVMHSYGGCLGSAAVIGMSKEDMIAQDKRGGVIGLIYLCAFIVTEGDPLLSKLPSEELEPWQHLTDDGQIIVQTPKINFYDDVPAPYDQLAIDMLKPQAYTCIKTPIPAQSWHLPFYNGRRAYLKCTEDKAVLLVAQEAMIQYSGVEWNVTELNTSHSPFLSQPQAVTDFIVKEAEKFVKIDT